MVERPGVPEAVQTVPNEIAIALLVAKIHSETEEIARDLTNPEEYGDVLDALFALARRNGVSIIDIQDARARKLADKGGFEQRLFWSPTSVMEPAA
ncbi:hypothetical protein [Aureimonas sp. AU40]|uniref:hypothetical protein n=1 Tax=Aureimonas sp. AU40 TaxID=1637747 RepID=UPI000783E69B|nr:hypothetical protein [Aureimonas sp. AU40]